MRSWRSNDHEQRGRQIAAEEEQMQHQHSPFIDETPKRVQPTSRPLPETHSKIDVKKMSGTKKWSLIILSLVIDAAIIAGVIYYFFIR